MNDCASIKQVLLGGKKKQSSFSELTLGKLKVKIKAKSPFMSKKEINKQGQTLQVDLTLLNYRT